MFIKWNKEATTKLRYNQIALPFAWTSWCFVVDVFGFLTASGMKNGKWCGKGVGWEPARVWNPIHVIRKCFQLPKSFKIWNTESETRTRQGQVLCLRPNCPYCAPALRWHVGRLRSCIYSVYDWRTYTRWQAMRRRQWLRSGTMREPTKWLDEHSMSP